MNGFKRMRDAVARRAGVLLALALLPALAGCQSIREHPSFASVPTPLEGGSIDPAVWDVRIPDKDVAASQQGIPYGQPFASFMNGMADEGGVAQNVVWLFPFEFYGKGFQLNTEGQTAETVKFEWNDLGFKGFMLPVRVAYDKWAYDKSSTVPTGLQSIRWNPLWASAQSSGNPRMEATAVGIPLFWSMVSTRDEDSEGTSMMIGSAFWTLGPQFVTFDGHNGSDRDRMTAFVPLALAGPGSLLWSDYAADVNHEDKQCSVIGHGPLMGGLGYLEARQKPLGDDEQKKPHMATYRRYILTGAAWYDVERGLVHDATHGVLWGGFGYGERAGTPVARVFWFSIPFGE